MSHLIRLKKYNLVDTILPAKKYVITVIGVFLISNIFLSGVVIGRQKERTYLFYIAVCKRLYVDLFFGVLRGVPGVNCVVHELFYGVFLWF